MERVTGIEPAFSAWEADVLPLNYTRQTFKEPPLERISGRVLQSVPEFLSVARANAIL